MVSILFYYFWRRSSFYFATIFVVASAIVLTADSLELARILHSNAAHFGIVIKLAMMKNLSNMEKIYPFLIMGASAIFYINMTKNSEFIIAKASGMSIWRIILPVTTTYVLFSLLNLLILAPATSHLLSKYIKEKNFYARGHYNITTLSDDGLWMIEKNNDLNIMYAKKIDSTSQEMMNLVIFRINDDHSFKGRLDAANAKLNNGHLVLQNPRIIDQNYNIFYEKDKKIKTNITFKQIEQSIKPPELIPLWDLHQFIASTKKSGFNTLKHEAYLYKHIVSPLLFFAMSVLGIAIGAIFLKSSNTILFIICSVIFTFSLYLLFSALFTLSTTANISMLFANILPSGLSLFSALIVILHLEE